MGGDSGAGGGEQRARAGVPRDAAGQTAPGPRRLHCGRAAGRAVSAGSAPPAGHGHASALPRPGRGLRQPLRRPLARQRPAQLHWHGDAHVPVPGLREDGERRRGAGAHVLRGHHRPGLRRGTDLPGDRPAGDGALRGGDGEVPPGQGGGLPGARRGPLLLHPRLPQVHAHGDTEEQLPRHCRGGEVRPRHPEEADHRDRVRRRARRGHPHQRSCPRHTLRGWAESVVLPVHHGREGGQDVRRAGHVAGRLRRRSATLAALRPLFRRLFEPCLSAWLRHQRRSVPDACVLRPGGARSRRRC
mmetsp:Transcript_46962/g.140214  ORF Transcript_46962/g.140214 Transcript_46962/m.140214 type:complete len:301 (+) Transcript_46962:527-1429(+)